MNAPSGELLLAMSKELNKMKDRMSALEQENNSLTTKLSNQQVLKKVRSKDMEIQKYIYKEKECKISVFVLIVKEVYTFILNESIYT